MLKYIFITISLFYVSYSIAQAPGLQWKKYYGTTADDFIYGIANSPDGGYITIGHSGQSFGNHDIRFTKIDANGNEQWFKTFATSSADKGWSIKATPEGGYIACGMAGSLTGEANNTFSNDVWVIKLDSVGNLEWQNCFGGNGIEVGKEIILTSDGGYMVLANSNSVYSGDVELFGGGHNFWVVKITGAGIKQWTKVYGGALEENAWAIKQTTDGGYIMTGSAKSSTGYLTNNKGGFDIWVLKINNSGVIEWQRNYGGSANDNGHDIIQTYDGGYMVVGDTSSSDHDFLTSENEGFQDIFLLKIANNGDIEWVRTHGTSGKDLASSVMQTADLGYIISGYGINSSIFPGPSGFLSNAVVARFNNNGDLLWGQGFGGTSDDGFDYLTLAADGGYIFGGFVSGNIAGSIGAYDGYVVKLLPETLGINISHKIPLVSIYPNPVYDDINVIADSSFQLQKIQIIDLKSNVVYSSMVPSAKIDVTHLSSGMYFIRFESDDQTQILKFIKL